MAALAGLSDPWRSTLREIVWRFRAIRMEEWSRVAWLLLYQPRFSKQTFELADFHPFLKRKWISPDEFAEDRKKLKGYLPPTLTNEEREVRWELWNQKQEAKKNVGE